MTMNFGQFQMTMAGGIVVSLAGVIYNLAFRHDSIGAALYVALGIVFVLGYLIVKKKFRPEDN